MDRVGADFENTLRMMRERLGTKAVAIQIPVGQGEMFAGIIDLIEMNYRIYHEETFGATFEDQPIPKSFMETSRKKREELLEALSEYDDRLMEKFLSEKPIEPEEIKKALRKGSLDAKVVPVLCGASFKNKGVQKLLDVVVDYLPSPVDLPAVKGVNPESGETEERKVSDDEPFSALAFKIVSDPFIGKLTYFRVYSGFTKVGTVVLNGNNGEKERLSRVLRMHANQRKEIEEVYAGDIVAVVGLKSVSTGNTFCDRDHPIVLEKMVFPEPVIAVAIEPKTKTDQDKLTGSLSKLSDEDPTFKVSFNEETGQTIISGMGELHLEILVERMLREFGVKANVGKPQVAYRETISIPVEAEGKFIRQTGGRGQYGHVKLRLEPLTSGEKYVFEKKISSGVIPREYFSAIEKGIKEAMSNGVLAGYPMVNIKAILYDGSYHEVDSSEIAFKIAASMAFQEGAKKALPKLLEPVMDVEVVVPEEYMGDVIGDLNARRGSILGIHPRADAQVISVLVPLSEMFGYATRLRSLTQGRAVFSIEFTRYQEVPENLSEKILTKVRGY